MTHPRLPLELLHHIIHSDSLSSADQCSLSLTAHLLRDESQRALFEAVGPLTLGPWNSVKSPPANCFFRAIISSPRRLALMVRSYTQTIHWNEPSQPDDGDYDKKTHRHQIREIYHLMSSSLKLMINLKRLSSCEEISADRERYRPVSIAHGLVQSTFTLETLFWSHASCDNFQLLEQFLPHQRALKSLSLPGSVDESCHENHIERIVIAGRNMGHGCPQLESLHAPLFTARIILAGGAKIKFLRWEPTRHPPDPDDITIPMNLQRQALQALQTVQSLQFTTGHQLEYPLTNIASYLTTLVVLTISNRHITAVPDIAHSLPSLRAVQFFHSFGMRRRSAIASAWNDVQTRVNAIFVNHANLRYVEVEHFIVHGHNAYIIECRRFTRLSDPSLVQELAVKFGEEAAMANRWRERWWRDREVILAELLREDKLDI